MKLILCVYQGFTIWYLLPDIFMSLKNKLFEYLSDDISFTSREATKLRTIYFPLCGVTSDSIKSSITPFLSGDIKIDKNHYITKPVSTEDLRHDARNFFVYTDQGEIFSLARDQGEALVEAGQLWHKLTRKYPECGIELEVLNFVPVTGENVELMRVRCANLSKEKKSLTPTAVIPLFARALANKHDHEHVTSLLHRIEQRPQGILVEPSMTFNEEGHKENNAVYYVFGIEDSGKDPVGTFPTTDSFYGDHGTPSHPEAVINNASPKMLLEEAIQGKEAVGALRFEKIELAPGEGKEYFIAVGMTEDLTEPLNQFSEFNTAEKFDKALEKTKAYWFDKTQAIVFKTGKNEFNSWMHWVILQPILRRIYGCSFLPDHDYGKGGKGWRDIWQDLLSLILIEPEGVRDVLINNFAGVRIDGSNATIIGSAPGEFLADRNAITRVWMDHGVWPFMTLLLYINQTGDYAILLEENTYFRDLQMSRTFSKDTPWTPEYGRKLKDTQGNIYKGTLIEHVLVQNLVQFFNVGEHNITRLESADWNDGLDMAFDRGESVAFMSCYGGNFLAMADLLTQFASVCKIQKIFVAKEIKILLDTLGEQKINYESIDAKRECLFDIYFSAVQPELSGEKNEIKIEDVATDLRKKGEWIFQHIRKQEKLTVDKEGFKDSWFNGYYDNKAKKVEGQVDGNVRMTLTGQVFPIMSGAAQEEDIGEITVAVRRYLRDRRSGGFRLNTNFGLKHYLDLGRAFGFAYGTKENGAVFSHMTVMYAYALYHRGFAKEGHEVLRSLYQMAMDTEKSRIYPGIPEYFDSEGKGMYHYLTGSASWLVLTQLTQVFGVRGQGGDLVLAPALVQDQFDAEGKASVTCQFAGKKITVIYKNANNLNFGEYTIDQVFLNNRSIEVEEHGKVVVKIKRSILESSDKETKIEVVLK